MLTLDTALAQTADYEAELPLWFQACRPLARCRALLADCAAAIRCLAPFGLTRALVALVVLWTLAREIEKKLKEVIYAA
jgi:hypothetical protein